MIEELYREYGKMVIHAEIIQNQLMEVKRKIAAELEKIKEDKKDAVA